jgi:hypothetical protein
MFAFFKPATPATEVANALWAQVLNSPMTRELAASASEDKSMPHSAALDEAVYFLGFAMDLTIHRVFERDATREQALREGFLEHLRAYATERRCPPCPSGDWLHDSDIWEIRSVGRDSGIALQHLSDRFDLYAAAMRRPPHRWLRSSVFSAPSAILVTSPLSCSLPRSSPTFRDTLKTFFARFAFSHEKA